MATSSSNPDDEAETEPPGAARFGNFTNYYTFNPPENRLSLIPATLLRDLGYGGGTTLILDVGCNSGDLSTALYEHLVPVREAGREVHLLGCDLDQDLIRRAQRANPSPGAISFIPADVLEDDPRLRSYLELRGRPSFHLCVCLAVTMWVHLNHGDAGLRRLLSRLASLGRHLLLEAQPWKCYRSAARRLRKLGRDDFDHFGGLEIRGDVAARVTEHLRDHCGMELVRSFGRTSWDRQLLLFKRR